MSDIAVTVTPIPTERIERLAEGIERKKIPPQSDRRRTAIHEAGHAVIACVLSIPFKHVTIKPRKSDNSCGHLERVAGGRITDTSDFESAVVSFAGPAAEIEFGGEVDPLEDQGYFKYIRRGAHRGDCANVRVQLSMILGETGTPAYRALRAMFKRDALTLVRGHQPEIEHVAKALLKHETLSSKRVHKLVAEYSP